MLLNKIGSGVEVHHIDEKLMAEAVIMLQKRQIRKLIVKANPGESLLPVE